MQVMTSSTGLEGHSCRLACGEGAQQGGVRSQGGAGDIHAIGGGVHGVALALSDLGAGDHDQCGAGVSHLVVRHHVTGGVGHLYGGAGAQVRYIANLQVAAGGVARGRLEYVTGVSRGHGRAVEQQVAIGIQGGVTTGEGAVDISRCHRRGLPYRWSRCRRPSRSR